MTAGLAWTDAQVRGLEALYYAPELFTVTDITERLNLALGTNFTLKSISAKLRRLGITNRPDPSDNWTAPREARLIELHKSPDAPSCRTIAEMMNREFATAFSRCAILGKINRLGLSDSRPASERWPAAEKKPRASRALPERERAERLTRPPMENVETVKLRCVEIVARHLSLVDLEPGDCRYPFGGDALNEPITFCGHPSRDGSPYCTPHFHLCRGQGTVSERIATRGIAA